MNTVHRFQLRRGSAKDVCPSCRQKSFTPYCDTEDMYTIVDDTVGWCDRREKCGYHMPPRMFFAEQRANGHQTSFKFSTAGMTPMENGMPYRRPSKPPEPKPSYIPEDKAKRTYEADATLDNPFVQFLVKKYGADTAQGALERFGVGSIKPSREGHPFHEQVATVFWQIDAANRYRSGKMICYGDDGHRLDGVDWVHTYLRMGKGYNLVQVFFGEHQLSYKEDIDTLCIVEAEKTAVIACMHRPDLHWMAAGAMHGINDYKMKRVMNHYKRIIFFPDAHTDAYERWDKQARKYHVAINTALGDNMDGIDIADVLLDDEYAKAFSDTLMDYNYQYA